MRLWPFPHSDHTESGAEGPDNAEQTEKESEIKKHDVLVKHIEFLFTTLAKRKTNLLFLKIQNNHNVIYTAHFFFTQSHKCRGRSWCYLSNSQFLLGYISRHIDHLHPVSERLWDGVNHIGRADKQNLYWNRE